MRKVSAEEKDFLSQEEAIEHFGLSRRKFHQLLKTGKDTPFLALYGKRRLILRAEFAKYLEQHPELRGRV